MLNALNLLKLNWISVFARLWWSLWENFREKTRERRRQRRSACRYAEAVENCRQSWKTKIDRSKQFKRVLIWWSCEKRLFAIEREREKKQADNLIALYGWLDAWTGQKTSLIDWDSAKMVRWDCFDKPLFFVWFERSAGVNGLLSSLSLSAKVDWCTAENFWGVKLAEGVGEQKYGTRLVWSVN